MHLAAWVPNAQDSPSQHRPKQASDDDGSSGCPMDASAFGADEQMERALATSGIGFQPISARRYMCSGDDMDQPQASISSCAMNAAAFSIGERTEQALTMGIASPSVRDRSKGLGDATEKPHAHDVILAGVSEAQYSLSQHHSEQASAGENDGGSGCAIDAVAFGTSEQSGRALETVGIGIETVLPQRKKEGNAGMTRARNGLTDSRRRVVTVAGSEDSRSSSLTVTGHDREVEVDLIADVHPAMQTVRTGDNTTAAAERRESIKNAETIIDKFIQNGQSVYLNELFKDEPLSSEEYCSDQVEKTQSIGQGSSQLRLGQKTTIQLLQEMTTSVVPHGSFVNVEPDVSARYFTSRRGQGHESVEREEIATDGIDESGNHFVDTIRTDTSWSHFDDLIRRVIELEFPKQDFPTARRVINIGRLHENRARYRPGSWVEIRGFDMKWRLDMITRVVKQAPDDWDWSDPNNAGKQPKWKFYYHAGEHRRLREEELRSPEEGLRRVFGNRPWVWQQWACVKLENKLRFQKGHQNDCIIFDVQKYVAELWDEWLNHPNNSDFKALFDDNRVGDFGRSELLIHMMKPFKLMERIKEDKEVWDFSNDRCISVFTYLGLLGSGYPIPCLIMMIQVAIPVLLALAVGGCPLIQWLKFNVCVSDKEREEGGYDLEEYRDGTYHVMAIVIFILYLVRVVPDTLFAFYNTFGSHSSVYSRLLSLRQLLWSQGDDTFGQMLGYKLDIYMNTAYVSALYLLNIYIILHTDQVLDIILNSLAFEFIARIDEELTDSLWWDPEQRWITAGAMSVVLQTTVQLKWLKDAKLFSHQFDIDEADLLAACDHDPHLMCNARVSSEDTNNMKFMSKDEIIQCRFRRVAHELHNENAIDEYEKPSVYFGFLDRYIRALFNQRDKSAFNRFINYRTWSRWEHVLYMSPVPYLDDLFETKRGKMRLAKGLESVAPPRDEFANFDPNDQGVVGKRMFLHHVIDVLLLKHMFFGLVNAWREEKFRSFVFRLFDGIIQWVVYVVTISFPFFVMTAIVAVATSMRQLPL